MNFRPELAAAVMAGSKTVTRRVMSDNPRSPWWKGGCKFRVGQVVAVCPGRAKVNIGHARVTSVERVVLGWLSEEEARREGFKEPSDFVATFDGLNGGYDPESEVWRLGLEPVA